MNKIAITGNIGMGKTTVSNIFLKKGFKVLDVDELSHNILNENETIEKIVEIFPSIFINNKIDRKKLANIVFNDKDKLKKLEAVLHPLIIDKIKKVINENDNIVIDIPLLFELKLEYLFTDIICVYVSKNKQIKRIKKRDNRTYKQIKKIINNQLSIEYKKAHSNYAIDTSSYKNIKKEINKIVRRVYENK